MDSVGRYWHNWILGKGDNGVIEEESLGKDEIAFKLHDGSTQVVKEQSKGGLRYWTKDGLLSKDVSDDAKDTIKKDKKADALTEKAELRQEECWCWNCTNKASVWVREVQFDLKHVDARRDYAVVSSADYPGPVPGFCIGHVATGPEQLAETVYKSRAEMAWGFRPSRWWVVFTDGTSAGGDCIAIELSLPQLKVVDECVNTLDEALKV